ncbi:DUF4148 domain-containing protein [Aquabacterium sp. OR-4]|uniref:DUF4148 domain-containing protein n=1 Tax=Aquabacterium sp. OR-4 TaxID=2978127 RepID=UPI0028C84D15|nr:DUF4148 domain-containing protein [Aquabacterium sp. OR-4]MDT7835218.1 DUF4148 domain-containing protein [Aquabacterium sp. OR-4]
MFDVTVTASPPGSSRHRWHVHSSKPQFEEEAMKKSLITLSAVIAAVFASQAAMAQEAPKARAEVKKEAAAAEKAGTLPKGEDAGAKDAAKSTKARAEVKKEAAAAEKAGTAPKGEGAGAVEKPKSTKARAEVKKEAAAAEKAGTLPVGEATKK